MKAFKGSGDIKYSVIVPVYLNEDSMQEMVQRFSSLNDKFSGQLEAIFVVDGSPDSSYAILRELLPSVSFPARLVSHSRNFGSFAAIKTGFSLARGSVMAVMAADLQEPIELVIDFFRELDKGEAEIVLGVRKGRTDPFTSRVSSGAFWWMYKRLVHREIPPGGVDVFAVTKPVAQTLLEMTESHSSLIGQLMWVGYRKAQVMYSRLPRRHGKSAWSISKKIRYLNDSIYSFTSLPIVIILTIGLLGTLISGLLALVVLSTWLIGGIPVPGYAAQMIAQLFSTGSILFAMGVLGTYIWRTYENSKHRPPSIVMYDEVF